MTARTERRQDARHIAWLAVEATGVDPDRDALLQIALVVTSPELEPLEEHVCSVWQSEDVLARMSPLARDVHTATGLLERVRGSRLDLATAERQVLERVAGWCPFGAVLAGSVLDVQRAFLRRGMPALSGYLAIRGLDVSALRTVARLWRPDAPPFTAPTDGSEFGELRRSIEEARHYRRAMFGGSDHWRSVDGSPSHAGVAPYVPVRGPSHRVAP